MPKTKLTLEYDGGPFAGWARQPSERSVQEEVEKALATVLHQQVALTVAGRTDRGVHARAQVASYVGEPAAPRRLNALLPPEIAVLGAEAMAEGFDARRDATSRAYCYRVLLRPTRSAFERDRAFWWPHQLDFELLEECTGALLGRHDFTAFTPSDTYHRRMVRDIYTAYWRREGEIAEFWIEADSFMRHMNRILVGTMFDVASGKLTLEQFTDLLEGCPRSQASRTFPAHGLYLVGVGYEERILPETHSCHPERSEGSVQIPRLRSRGLRPAHFARDDSVGP